MTDPLAGLKVRFRERSATDLERLRVLVQGDPASVDLRYLVHSLAGAAGTFGFPALSEAAALIDDAYAAGRLPERTMFDRLERELEVVTTPQP